MLAVLKLECMVYFERRLRKQVSSGLGWGFGPSRASPYHLLEKMVGTHCVRDKGNKASQWLTGSDCLYRVTVSSIRLVQWPSIIFAKNWKTTLFTSAFLYRVSGSTQLKSKACPVRHALSILVGCLKQQHASLLLNTISTAKGTRKKIDTQHFFRVPYREVYTEIKFEKIRTKHKFHFMSLQNLNPLVCLNSDMASVAPLSPFSCTPHTVPSPFGRRLVGSHQIASRADRGYHIGR